MRTSTDLRRLKREFDAADPHSLGYIGPPELRKICQQRGLIATEEQVRAMLLTMDSNSDGKISFREFCAFHHKFADPGKASKLSPFLQESVNRRSTGTVPRPFTAPPAPVASRTGGIQPQVTTSYAVLTARFRIPGECCWFTCLCAYVCMGGCNRRGQRPVHKLATRLSIFSRNSSLSSVVTPRVYLTTRRVEALLCKLTRASHNHRQCRKHSRSTPWRVAVPQLHTQIALRQLTLHDKSRSTLGYRIHGPECVRIRTVFEHRNRNNS